MKIKRTADVTELILILAIVDSVVCSENNTVL